MTRVQSRKHLDFIRSLPCLVCGDNTSTEAAHVRMADRRFGKKITGIGIKPSDCWTVPLCGKCHRGQHSVGEEEFWHPDLDPMTIAAALFIHTGDVQAAQEVLDYWRD